MTSEVHVTSERMTADQLRDLLGRAANGAIVEDSALEMMRYIDSRAVAAIGEALAERAPLILASRIYGLLDSEDNEWKQVVLDVSGAEAGSKEWRENLDGTGAALELAFERCPTLQSDITAIGFHF